MKEYDSHLYQFRNMTLLRRFCRIDKENIRQPEGFQEVATKFEEHPFPISIPDDITLQHVENFRQVYGKHYKLRDFALMLSAKVKLRSYILSFVVPQSIVRRLQSNIPKQTLARFGITGLNIAGECIYGNLTMFESPATSPQPSPRSSIEHQPLLASNFKETRIGSDSEEPAVIIPYRRVIKSIRYVPILVVHSLHLFSYSPYLD